jgi:hypothetical protein
MHLSEVNNALDHKICGGSEYGWNCWPNARFLDYESEYAHASVVFNSETQEIYTAEINDKADKYKPYRWLNPDYKKVMYAEARQRRIEANLAWDEVMWCDLETPEDWIEKASAIMRNEDFDDRVQIPLTLDKDELYKLMEMAHERDVTLNKMVEIILEEMILRHRNDDLKR